jgi:hypothetical protein
MVSPCNFLRGPVFLANSRAETPGYDVLLFYPVFRTLPIRKAISIVLGGA